MELTALLNKKTDDLAIWAEFKGFEIRLPYVDKPALEALVNRSKSRNWDRKHQLTEAVDETKLVKSLAGLIKDWRGLTLGLLATLLPIDIAGQDADAPVSFTAENATVLIKQVYGLDDFIIETITDLQRFRSATLDDEEKN